MMAEARAMGARIAAEAGRRKALRTSIAGFSAGRQKSIRAHLLVCLPLQLR